MLLLSALPIATQDIPPEYRVKAGHLFNFVNFVEWPAQSSSAALTICVAGHNPFGSVLEDLVKNEKAGDRPIEVRVILEPAPGCHVVFTPQGSATTAYVRAARGMPVLTVGETDDFIAQGGIVSFYAEGDNVRFAINPDAAQRAQLRLSARLLQLARIVDDHGDPR